MKYIVPIHQTLLDAVIGLSPASSKNTLRSWIKEGRVEVDGRLIKNPSTPLLPGQQIIVGNRKKFLPGDIEILYEDKDVVVINKPSGLLSVSSAFEKGETAHAILKSHYHPRNVFVVHRLDQDTSGVMVFAFNPYAFEELKTLFHAHDIERSYTAIVEGRFAEPKGTWETHQFEDEQYYVHETDDDTKGRLAITHYETLAHSKNRSWLQLTLETGRKNQIRVHCQSAGHSIVGDKKYGAMTNPIKRLCLHAHLLAFKHPDTKKMIRVESPIPEEFYRLVPSKLKK